MRVALILLLPVLMGQAAPPPLVPEGIHSTGQGPPTLCGSTAANIVALEQKIAKDPSFREHNSNDRYRVFVREPDFVQFAFPRPGYLAFGMATCIRVTANADNSSTIHRQLYCDGSRSECDRIFVEWNQHDQAVQKSLESKAH